MKVVLTSDGSRTLFSERAGQCFHSESGAVSESRTVYLKNSGALSRLQQGTPTTVLEIGLGTGLSFLLTADVALQNETHLKYTGLDVALPSADDVRELSFDAFIEHRDLLSSWLHFLESGETNSTTFGEFVQLVPSLGAAESAVQDTDSFPDKTFDCIYLDAFSPEASPELWSGSFIGHLFRLLRPSGTLTTYCVKSSIQRRFKAAGFVVKCLPGPEGGKRQVLLATKDLR